MEVHPQEVWPKAGAVLRGKVDQHLLQEVLQQGATPVKRQLRKARGPLQNVRQLQQRAALHRKRRRRRPQKNKDYADIRRLLLMSSFFI
jgi:hypothetical protein